MMDHQLAYGTPHTHAHTHMHTHAHAHTHMHTHAHAHTHMHTHACTHTHTIFQIVTQRYFTVGRDQYLSSSSPHTRLLVCTCTPHSYYTHTHSTLSLPRLPYPPHLSVQFDCKDGIWVAVSTYFGIFLRKFHDTINVDNHPTPVSSKHSFIGSPFPPSIRVAYI